jgi:uracil phosphoribosyltransferase
MMLEHLYGDQVHISDDAWLRTLLVRIGSPDTPVREVPELVRAAYRLQLPGILSEQIPVVEERRATRMSATEPRAMYAGPMLCQSTKLVVVAVVRGGILPAQTCYEEACRVLPPANVRLDFLNMSRTTDGSGSVTGVRFDGSKIGGPVNDAVVLIPDPMGATGGTIARCMEVYRDLNGGAPRSLVAAHLMVTPEAILRLKGLQGCLQIYSGRLDRGLSAPKILKTVPGTHPEQEQGLTDNQYIVPGAGGIGELLTNAWV